MYKRNALRISESLREAYGDIDIEINNEKPRGKSFEITLLKDGDEHAVWSGIKLGPPRKLKFPEVNVVLEKVRKITQ